MLAACAYCNRSLQSILNSFKVDLLFKVLIAVNVDVLLEAICILMQTGRCEQRQGAGSKCNIAEGCCVPHGTMA
jgi:hypothetical protein